MITLIQGRQRGAERSAIAHDRLHQDVIFLRRVFHRVIWQANGVEPEAYLRKCDVDLAPSALTLKVYTDIFCGVYSSKYWTTVFFAQLFFFQNIFADILED